MQIIWTPGHSPGHICLYEHARRMFISGDHVLPHITPNVSMHSQSLGNPLGDYLNSLRQVAELAVDVALPAHCDTISDFGKRVGEIRDHHVGRMRAIVQMFNGEPRTAWQIAAALPWTDNMIAWKDLTPMHQRLAVTETLSHLELLQSHRALGKRFQEGLVWYDLPDCAGNKACGIARTQTCDEEECQNDQRTTCR